MRFLSNISYRGSVGMFVYVPSACESVCVWVLACAKIKFKFIFFFYYIQDKHVLIIGCHSQVIPK